MPLYRTLATFEILSSKVAVTSCPPTLQVRCVAHKSLLGSTWSFRQDLLFGGRTAALGSHQGGRENGLFLLVKLPRAFR